MNIIIYLLIACLCLFVLSAAEALATIAYQVFKE